MQMILFNRYVLPRLCPRVQYLRVLSPRIC